MPQIFDFMNVESIHNKAFNDSLPATFLAQARDLANWHEYGVFSSPNLSGIGNSRRLFHYKGKHVSNKSPLVAGRAILPSILSSLNSIANSSDPLKLTYEAIAYKPFLSLFNMTGVAQMNPELAGVG